MQSCWFHGYTIDGGYAEYTVANEHYCFPLPAMYANVSGANLVRKDGIDFLALAPQNRKL